MSNKNNRVTYEELSDVLSHYEISYLATFKAIDIIKSGVSLITDSPYKPKVALVALSDLCSDSELALKYKEEIKERLFCANETDISDEYNIEQEDCGLSDSDTDEEVIKDQKIENKNQLSKDEPELYSNDNNSITDSEF